MGDRTGGLARSPGDHPGAQAPSADATLTPEAVAGRQDRWTAFLRRHLPRSYRVERRAHAGAVPRGPLRGLGRKTCEPIAPRAGLHREAIRTFVGAGARGDDAVIDEVREHGRDELADPRAITIPASGGLVKEGTASWGAARRGWGRPGAVDNCRVGIVAADAAPRGGAPVGRRLDLPAGRVADADRREATPVPEGVTSQGARRIAADSPRRTADSPRARIAGGDGFGRPAEFRRRPRKRGEGYLPDVPCAATIRDPERRRPARRRAGAGRKRAAPSCRVETRAAPLRAAAGPARPRATARRGRGRSRRWRCGSAPSGSGGSARRDARRRCARPREGPGRAPR